MTTPTGQTQVPPAGNGGEGQGQQGPQPNADLEKRLADLQAQLQQKDREAKLNQARADRAEQRLTDVVARPPAGRPGGVQGTPPRPPAAPPAAPVQSQDDTMAQLLQEQQRELTLLRELSRRGLSPEEVEGIQFADASTLAVQLDILQQKKEIAALRDQLSQRRESGAQESGEGAGTSEVQVDTGGRTSGGADARLRRAQDYRSQAGELRKQGRHQEATWLALRAAHNDPSKKSVVRTEEE